MLHRSLLMGFRQPGIITSLLRVQEKESFSLHCARVKFFDFFLYGLYNYLWCLQLLIKQPNRKILHTHKYFSIKFRTRCLESMCVCPCPTPLSPPLLIIIIIIFALCSPSSYYKYLAGFSLLAHVVYYNSIYPPSVQYTQKTQSRPVHISPPSFTL